jgi:GT2 family glycosyltransferase
MNESTIHRIGRTDVVPLVSIVVLNYNGAEWLPKCFDSIKTQTIIDRLETILVDNNSSDGSVELARQFLADFPMACIVQNSENLWFCAGNNSGARVAKGRYVLFLNNDTWLEPDCMERLIEEVQATGAGAATPLVLNYHDDSYQDLGFFGFDLFGLPSPSFPQTETREILVAGGCSLLIERELFDQLGMFDPEYFIYSDDTDLSWRVWIAGRKVIAIPAARLHHRGAAGVNPAGGEQTLEFRTTDRKRFLTNRNSLLTLLKNGQHLLLLLAPLQMALVAVESLVGVLVLRRLRYFRRACLAAFGDCWRLRKHVLAERKRVAGFRQRSDWWMLRFFRWRLNRWFEIKRLFQFGLPRVDAR